MGGIYADFKMVQGNGGGARLQMVLAQLLSMESIGGCVVAPTVAGDCKVRCSAHHRGQRRGIVLVQLLAIESIDGRVVAASRCPIRWWRGLQGRMQHESSGATKR